jgi:hypothetical protein
MFCFQREQSFSQDAVTANSVQIFGLFGRTMFPFTAVSVQWKVISLLALLYVGLV